MGRRKGLRCASSKSVKFSSRIGRHEDSERSRSSRRGAERRERLEAQRGRKRGGGRRREGARRRARIAHPVRSREGPRDARRYASRLQRWNRLVVAAHVVLGSAEDRREAAQKRAGRGRGSGRIGGGGAGRDQAARWEKREWGEEERRGRRTDRAAGAPAGSPAIAGIRNSNCHASSRQCALSVVLIARSNAKFAKMAARKSLSQAVINPRAARCDPSAAGPA